MINLFLAGPIIAAVVGVFIGIRNSGSLLRSIIATLISSIAGYLLLFIVIAFTTFTMLPMTPQPDSSPSQPNASSPQIGAEVLLTLFIPQAVVGVITSAIAAKALARG